MDTKKLKVMILSSRVNEPRKARKAEEIVRWLYSPMYGWEKPGQ
jgi:hypothetical protein